MIVIRSFANDPIIVISIIGRRPLRSDKVPYLPEVNAAINPPARVKAVIKRDTVACT